MSTKIARATSGWPHTTRALPASTRMEAIRRRSWTAGCPSPTACRTCGSISSSKRPMDASGWRPRRIGGVLPEGRRARPPVSHVHRTERSHALPHQRAQRRPRRQPLDRREQRGRDEARARRIHDIRPAGRHQQRQRDPAGPGWQPLLPRIRPGRCAGRSVFEGGRVDLVGADPQRPHARRLLRRAAFRLVRARRGEETGAGSSKGRRFGLAAANSGWARRKACFATRPRPGSPTSRPRDRSRCTASATASPSRGCPGCSKTPPATSGLRRRTPASAVSLDGRPRVSECASSRSHPDSNGSASIAHARSARMPLAASGLASAAGSLDTRTERS